MLPNQSCGDRPQLYRRRRWTTTPPLAPPAPPLVVSLPPSRRRLLVAARRCGWSCDRPVPGRLFHCPRRGALWCICRRVTWSRPERSSLQRIIFLPTSSAVLLLFSCNVVFHVGSFLFLLKVFAGRGRDEVYLEELTSPSSSSSSTSPNRLPTTPPSPPTTAGARRHCLGSRPSPPPPAPTTATWWIARRGATYWCSLSATPPSLSSPPVSTLSISPFSATDSTCSGLLPL